MHKRLSDWIGSRRGLNREAAIQTATWFEEHVATCIGDCEPEYWLQGTDLSKLDLTRDCDDLAKIALDTMPEEMFLSYVDEDYERNLESIKEMERVRQRKITYHKQRRARETRNLRAIKQRIKRLIDQARECRKEIAQLDKHLAHLEGDV